MSTIVVAMQPRPSLGISDKRHYRMSAFGAKRTLIERHVRNAVWAMTDGGLLPEVDDRVVEVTDEEGKTVLSVPVSPTSLGTKH